MRFLKKTTKSHSKPTRLNCLHSLRTKNILESHKKVCENTDFCHIVMPSQESRILEFNQYGKSDKKPFIIYWKIIKKLEKLELKK